MSADPNRINVSGPLIVGPAREIMKVLERAFARGLTPEIASHLFIGLGVDLFRANFGDEGAEELLRRTISMRMERPLEEHGTRREVLQGCVIPDTDDYGRPN